MNQRKFLAVIGSCLIYLIVGIPYVWGSLSTYALQYYQIKGYKNLSQTSINFIFPTINIFQFFGIITSVELIKLIGSRKLLFIGILGQFISLIVIILFQNIYTFFVGFGLGLGFFSGILYIPPLTVVSNYFSENKGKLIGLVLSFYGFSSIITNLIVIYTINPNNQQTNSENKYPDLVINQFPRAILIIAIYQLIIGILGASILKNRKNYLEEILHRSSIDSLNTKENQQNDVSPKEAYRSYAFYEIFLMNICSMVWGCYIMSNYKIYGLTFGYDDKFLSLIVGNIACFGNGLFRYFFGIMYDKFGFRKCYNFHLIINMITIITLPMVAHLKFMYTIWIFFSAIGEGSIYVLFSAQVIELFGSRYGPEIYSRVAITSFIGNFLQNIILHTCEQKYGINQIFYLFFLFLLISFIINNTFYIKHKNYLEKRFLENLILQFSQKRQPIEVQ